MLSWGGCMTDKLDKEYDFLYRSIQETNDYNKKYCSYFKAFFDKQPEDNLDYIKLIIELNLIKKGVGELREKIALINMDKKHGDTKIVLLFNDLDTYQKLIILSSEQLTAIIIRTRRKLNNIERYWRFEYKKDLRKLSDMESSREKMRRALTDLSVTFKNKHLKKAKRHHTNKFKVIVNDNPRP
jgi:hypothetical protein